jgi:hypothetical protein
MLEESDRSFAELYFLFEKASNNLVRKGIDCK